MGGIGYPLLSAIQQAPIPAGWIPGLMVAQILCHLIGDTAFGIFVQRVFRPTASWARALPWLTAGAVGGMATAQFFEPGLLAFARENRGPWRFHAVAALLPLAWSAGESFAYHGRMRRRLALGLADPVVTDRFLLWSLGMTAAFTIAGIDTALVLQGSSLIATRFGGLVIGCIGMISATTMWLAFFPPRAYLERVRRLAGAGVATR